MIFLPLFVIKKKKQKKNSWLGLCHSPVSINRPVSLVWVFEADVVVVYGHHKHGDVIADNAAKFSVWAPTKLSRGVYIVHIDLMLTNFLYVLYKIFSVGLLL